MPLKRQCHEKSAGILRKIWGGREAPITDCTIKANYFQLLKCYEF